MQSTESFFVNKITFFPLYFLPRGSTWVEAKNKTPLKAFFVLQPSSGAVTGE